MSRTWKKRKPRGKECEFCGVPLGEFYYKDHLRGGYACLACLYRGCNFDFDVVGESEIYDCEDELTEVCRKCGEPAHQDAEVNGSYYCDEHLEWAEKMAEADNELGHGFGRGGEKESPKQGESRSYRCMRCGKPVGQFYFVDLMNDGCICLPCFQRPGKTELERVSEIFCFPCVKE